MLLQFELNFPALSGFKIGESATLGETIEFLARQIKDPVAQLRGHAGGWPVGWLDLPAGGQHVAESKRIADKLAGEHEEMIVCGIGGSALGAQAVHSALDLSGARLRKLHVLDNVDPTQLSLLLEDVDIGKCAINVISKSGGTLETMTAFFYLIGEL
jgi:glucose-6-phosphate isomerase